MVMWGQPIIVYNCKLHMQALFQFNELSIYYISDTTYDSTLQIVQHVLSLLIAYLIW